ncbi:hypothetical protein RRG08_003040 [Elysia crispata]|uniref:Uncharacterized protein n=1 Tax=Elysia crispata TaxID=231223 RepID=A0AAE1B6Q8_9GAST|nr:hypothetical protein RRG08_003040 [Elysia crispata]
MSPALSKQLPNRAFPTIHDSFQEPTEISGALFRTSKSRLRELSQNRGTCANIDARNGKKTPPHQQLKSGLLGMLISLALIPTSCNHGPQDAKTKSKAKRDGNRSSCIYLPGPASTHPQPIKTFFSLEAKFSSARYTAYLKGFISFHLTPLNWAYDSPRLQCREILYPASPMNGDQVPRPRSLGYTCWANAYIKHRMYEIPAATKVWSKTDYFILFLKSQIGGWTSHSHDECETSFEYCFKEKI